MLKVAYSLYWEIQPPPLSRERGTGGGEAKSRERGTGEGEAIKGIST